MNKIFYWAGLLITAFVFGSAGGMKALGVAQMHQNMAEMHYPSWFTYALGISEVLGVVGLFFARFRPYVVLYFQAVLFGGIGSHISAGHGFDRLSFAFVGLLGLFLLIYSEKNRFSIQSN
jgi:hypothetical protein